MPIAPTPPTKPTPPVAPTFTPASASTSPDSHTAAPPANSTQDSSKPPSAGMASAGKELEGLGKAFQGNSTQSKVGEKAVESAAKAANQAQTIQAAPTTSFASQNEVSTQTVVPAKPPVMEGKSSGLSYLAVMGIAGVIAVILLGLRLYKIKNKQLRTSIDYSKRTTPVMNKAGTDVVISPQAASPKVERKFEVRV